MLFWLKKCSFGLENPKLQGEAKKKRCFFIWSYAHRCLVNVAPLFFYKKINGIDKIKGGFMYKVDYRKSSKIMFKLSMPQKAPKRRSPNIGERRSKWAKGAHLEKTLKKFGLMRLLKITVFQIGDLQNMLYFPSASHISPMETFALAD